jgi:hypothetical protein
LCVPVKLPMPRVSSLALIRLITVPTPGFVIVLGWCFAHPAASQILLSATSIGYGSKIALLVLASFVLGYTLNLLVTLPFMLLCGPIASIAAHKIQALQSSPLRGLIVPFQPWRNLQFKMLASRFLGENSVPTIDADEGWASWYGIFKAYFPQIETRSLIGMNLITSTYSVIWAILACRWMYPALGNTWLILSALVVTGLLTFLFFTLSLIADFGAVDFDGKAVCALILKELRDSAQPEPQDRARSAGV